MERFGGLKKHPAKFIDVMPYLKEFPKKIQPPEQNLFFIKNIAFFRVMQIMGCFPIIRNKEGRFEFRWRSYATLYTIIFITALLSYIALAILNFTRALKEGNFGFDEAVVSFAFAASAIVLILPAIVFLEAGKLANFLNDFTDFQLRFQVTINQTLRVQSMRNFMLTIFCISSATTTYVLLNPKGPMLNIIDKYGVPCGSYPVATMFANCAGYLTGTLMLFWRIGNNAVRNGAESIMADLQNFPWGGKKCISEHYYLWINLRSLCQNLADALAWTYLVICGFMFAVSLPSIYLGARDIMKGDNMTIFTAYFTLTYISIFAEIADSTVRTVGVGFESALTKILLKCSTQEHKMQLSEFIKNVVGCPPVMSLGGFFNVDRGIHMTLHASIITYFMVMIQFQPESNEDCFDRLTFLNLISNLTLLNGLH